jgi:uncharacterized protein
MLDRTFMHAQGVGAATERRLWAQGADSWSTFLADPARFRMPKSRMALMMETVGRSPGALARGDFLFFAERLKQREHWRALHAFPGRVAYLDIETCGGTDFDCVTVIGVSDGKKMQHFIRGENLLDFPDAVEDAAVLVTYFGNGFDLPVLRNAFPRARLNQLHIDLCPTLRRLGLTGGLKLVERDVGILRSLETRGLGGWDAGPLWRQWYWGSREALDLLLAYNRDDVVNLVPLARLAYDELSRAALRAGLQ